MVFFLGFSTILSITISAGLLSDITSDSQKLHCQLGETRGLHHQFSKTLENHISLLVLFLIPAVYGKFETRGIPLISTDHAIDSLNMYSTRFVAAIPGFFLFSSRVFSIAFLLCVIQRESKQGSRRGRKSRMAPRGASTEINRRCLSAHCSEL